LHRGTCRTQLSLKLCMYVLYRRRLHPRIGRFRNAATDGSRRSAGRQLAVRWRYRRINDSPPRRFMTFRCFRRVGGGSPKAHLVHISTFPHQRTKSPSTHCPSWTVAARREAMMFALPRMPAVLSHGSTVDPLPSILHLCTARMGPNLDEEAGTTARSTRGGTMRPSRPVQRAHNSGRAGRTARLGGCTRSH
jgi:hypothetical protein